MSVKVPVMFGVKVPFAKTPEPDQVPPIGVPEKTTGKGWLQIVVSIPAFTIGSGLTVAVKLSEEVQPFPSVNV